MLLLGGAFLGAELRVRWLRLLLFFAVAAAVVTSWGSPADFLKQFLASAILLAVVVFGMRRVVRFNLLGLFLIVAVHHRFWAAPANCSRSPTRSTGRTGTPSSPRCSHVAAVAAGDLAVARAARNKPRTEGTTRRRLHASNGLWSAGCTDGAAGVLTRRGGARLNVIGGSASLFRRDRYSNLREVGDLDQIRQRESENVSTPLGPGFCR